MLNEDDTIDDNNNDKTEKTGIMAGCQPGKTPTLFIILDRGSTQKS